MPRTRPQTRRSELHRGEKCLFGGITWCRNFISSWPLNCKNRRVIARKSSKLDEISCLTQQKVRRAWLRIADLVKQIEEDKPIFVFLTSLNKILKKWVNMYKNVIELWNLHLDYIQGHYATLELLPILVCIKNNTQKFLPE